MILATFKGTDVFQNIAPGGGGGLADKYPLSHYGLDFHVDGPGLLHPTQGVPENIAQFLASVLFSLSAWLMRAILGVFQWAFGLDLVNGPHGALNPIGRAAQHLHATTLAPYFVAAVSLLGLWAIHMALVRRKFERTAAGVAVSVAAIAVAGLIIAKPAATVGTASQMVNDGSAQLLSSATFKVSGDEAVRSASDHLFETFVYLPWTVLEFGGLQHCVGAETDDDGFPLPVASADPAKVTCKDHLKGDYAPRWLAVAPGSKARNDAYNQLNKGTAPYTKADSPAADMMQAGGAFQRLVVSVLVFGAVLGAALTLGLLCFAALIAQVMALGLLALAPAALLAGVFPGRGHDVFFWWLGKLGMALVAKALYSLLLAVLIAVSLALSAAAGAGVAFLVAFGLQAAFFWTVFLKRKTLASAFVRRRDVNQMERHVERQGNWAMAPVAAAGGAVAATPGALAETWRSAQEKVSQRRTDTKTEDGERPSTERHDGRSVDHAETPVRPSDTVPGTYQRNGQEGEKMAGSFKGDMMAAYREKRAQKEAPAEDASRGAPAPEPGQRRDTPAPEAPARRGTPAEGPPRPRSFEDSLSDARGRRQDAAITAALAPPAAPGRDSGRTRPDTPPPQEKRPEQPKRPEEPWERERVMRDDDGWERERVRELTRERMRDDDEWER